MGWRRRWWCSGWRRRARSSSSSRWWRWRCACRRGWRRRRIPTTSIATCGTARCSAPASIRTASRPMRPSWRRCATTAGRTSTIAQLPTIYPPLAQAAFAATPSLCGVEAAGRARPTRRWGCSLSGGWPTRGALVLWAWSPLVGDRARAQRARRRARRRAADRRAARVAARAKRRRRARSSAAAAAVKLLPAVALLGMRRRRAVGRGGARRGALLALPYRGGRRAHGRQPRRIRPALAGQRRRVRAALRAAPSGWSRTRRFAGAVRHGRLAAAGAPGDRARSRHALSRRGGQLRRARWRGRDASWRVAAGRCGGAPPRCDSTEVAIGAFVLLTPALHPWYVVWLLPLVAVGGSSGLAGAGAAGAARLSAARRVAVGRPVARSDLDPAARARAHAGRARH